jgi:hypothetical protein
MPKVILRKITSTPPTRRIKMRLNYLNSDLILLVVCNAVFRIHKLLTRNKHTMRKCGNDSRSGFALFTILLGAVEFWLWTECIHPTVNQAPADQHPLMKEPELATWLLV